MTVKIIIIALFHLFISGDTVDIDAHLDGYSEETSQAAQLFYPSENPQLTS